MKCPDCNRPFTPAPAMRDGEPVYVGFYICPCSYQAWLNSVDAEWGISFGEYHEQKLKEHATQQLTGEVKK